MQFTSDRGGMKRASSWRGTARRRAAEFLGRPPGAMRISGQSRRKSSRDVGRTARLHDSAHYDVAITPPADNTRYCPALHNNVCIIQHIRTYICIDRLYVYLYGGRKSRVTIVHRLIGLPARRRILHAATRNEKHESTRNLPPPPFLPRLCR